MNRSTQIARGSAVLIAGQLLAVGAQVIYGAATARILMPSAFGAFAIAISITGLFAIVLTAGLLTFVLAQREVSESTAWLIWIYTFLAACAGGSATFLLAPVWSRMWNSPSSTEMVRWLSIQVSLNCFSVAHAAFLRREHRALADATSQTVGVITGLGVGIGIAWTSRSPESLVVSPIVASLTTLTLAACLRRQRYRYRAPRGWRALLGLHSQISQQNLYFFAMSSLPVWLLGIAVDDHLLGLFSRAVVIPGLVYGALSTALMRSLQPYYRHLESQSSQGRATADAAILSGALSFPLFFGVAALAHPLVGIWLGPAWLQSARYVTPSAVGFAVYTIFAVVANAAETMGFLREVRQSQYAMVPGAVALGTFTLLLHSPESAALMTLAVGVCGLTRLLFALSARGVDCMKWLLKSLGVQICWSILICAIVWLIVRRLTSMGINPWVTLTLGGIGLLVMYACSTSRRPEWEVARRRNIVGRWRKARVLSRDGS